MSEITIVIDDNLLLRDGRGFLKIGPDAWAPTIPKPGELGARFSERELRLKHPLRALRRRVQRERKAPQVRTEDRQ